MENSVRKTGGQIDELVGALVDAAFDKKANVRNDMKCALQNLGLKQPELVLTSCNVYLIKHQKLVQGHRILLLEIMTKIIKDVGANISLDVSKELILLASNEMTKSKEIVPEWQTAASNTLVALGIHFSQEVMQEMLQKIVPGSLPHYFVILTLANLAKENVFGVVPFLKDIFSRVLPLLGLVRADNMRWVFSNCIGAFSEAILDYCANIDNAPYPDITKDRFAGEIFTCFEIMFGLWLNSSKEARVRLAVVEAFGYMTQILSKEKLEEHLQRLLNGITNLYKRHTEHFQITQSLGMVFSAACSDGSMMLLGVLDQMLNGLHAQTCIEPDFSNPQTIKNNNELLRCFQVLAQTFCDRVLAFLQQKLEVANEKSRTATISIFKHLINSSDELLSDRKEVILSSVSIVLLESNLKVCRSFAQCIIAMAHHDYLGLEGGEKMVEFIVRMCTLSTEEKPIKKVGDVESVSPAVVKSMCTNILNLMSTTIEVMEDVLWPYLLQFILPVQFTNALMPVCRALASIAARKWEVDDPNFSISHLNNVNIPKSEAIFARLIVIAGHPLKGDGRGIHVLNFLKAYSPNISQVITDMWQTVIPKLIAYLEDNSADKSNWNQKAWEDLILKLLAKTLSEIESEDWFLLFGREIGLQIPLYSTYPEEKNFLYKCLGVVLRKIGTTDFIREHLNLIFSSVDHTNQTEREGCAVGIGFCAASHLDQCLMKLEEITKTKMVRKSTGFMGLMKDKTEADVERIKCTVMLCYGYVVFYGPPGLMSSRLEASVLRVINPHFTSVKERSVKQNLIRAVELIGKAVQPKHLQRDDFIFTRRTDLLKHMKGYLQSEPKTAFTESRSLSIDAITNLVISKLDPPLTEEEIADVITVSTGNVYVATDTVPLTVGKAKVEENREHLGVLALESLNNLLKEIIRRDPTPKYLQTVLKMLESFLGSNVDHERERSIQSVKCIMKHYLQITNFTSGQRFNTLGYILGRLLPRCTDPETSIRQNSMECVQTLLTINDRYEGVPANISDERIEALTQLKETLNKNDPAVLFNVVNELSVVVSKKTPDEQVKTLVFSLIDGLKDVHSQSSSGACAILNCLMKFRGAELNKEVSTIVKDIITNLQMVTFPATITGSLVAMRTLATHHLIQVLRAFLDFPVPFQQNVCEFWKTLAKDKDLTSDTFDHLLDLLNRTPPYIEQEGSLKTATPLPMAICAALTEMFKVPETEALVSAMFPKLMSAVMLRMGSCLGVKVGKDIDSKGQKNKKEQNPSLSPISLSIMCFKELLSRCKYSSLQTKVDEMDTWSLFEEEDTFTKAIQNVVIAICECQPSIANEVVSSLLPSLSSMYNMQRMVPVAVYAELINQRCCGDLQLVELLMNSLLSKLVDPCHLVRQLCIRGLGNVASVGGQKLQTYSTTILSAMMAGMDDKEDPAMSITLEAMSGLNKILSLLEESAVRQILINICLRIRPCFEKENSAVRAAAIELFGNLSRFGHGPSEASFLEQVHTNFISILLHLNEQDEVKKACKTALRLLGPRLGSNSINDMFQKHLIEDGNLHYGEFMNDLSRLIIKDYMDKMNFYVMGCITFFKSNWEDIRANSALFVGFLLGNLPSSQRDTVATGHVCNALVVLLKDPEPKVRSKAAEAMSLLHDF